MSDRIESATRRGPTPRVAVTGLVAALTAVVALVWLSGAIGSSDHARSTAEAAGAMGSEARFAYLASQHTNYCSLDRATVAGYPDDQRMQGACCDAMDMDKYQQQVAGLRKYATISEIPKDPYDIEAGLAKRLIEYDDTITLTGQDKDTYDAAMQMTDNKAPCCCQCWRWYMTEGLDKFLITQQHLSAQQIAEITDLVNGCGGPVGATPSPSDTQPSRS